MPRSYKKQDAPAWHRKLVIVTAGFFAATLLLFVAWAVVLFIDWARVEACLDDGGSYDYERGECEFDWSRPVPETPPPAG